MKMEEVPENPVLKALCERSEINNMYRLTN